MFTSLKEIQAYIEECEQKHLDWITKRYGQRLIYRATKQPTHEAIMKAR